MPKIILTSSIADTGKYIPNELEKPASKYNLLFITTAAEGELPNYSDIEDFDNIHLENWALNDRNALEEAGFNIKSFTITNKTTNQLVEAIKNIDIIFCNGGNTFYLLNQLKKTGFDKIISDFLKNEGIYAGSSAGSVVAGIDIEPSRKTETLDAHLSQINTKGLGLVDFAILPHWGSKFFKKLYMETRLEQAYRPDYPITLLTDNSYIVSDMKNIRIVTN